ARNLDLEAGQFPHLLVPPPRRAATGELHERPLRLGISGARRLAEEERPGPAVERGQIVLGGRSRQANRGRGILPERPRESEPWSVDLLRDLEPALLTEEPQLLARAQPGVRFDPRAQHVRGTQSLDPPPPLKPL